jgi:hypothetical protein
MRYSCEKNDNVNTVEIDSGYIEISSDRWHYLKSRRLGQMFFWNFHSYRAGNFSFYNKTLEKQSWTAKLVGKYSDNYSKIIGNWHSVGTYAVTSQGLTKGLFIITPQAGEVEGSTLFLSELILYTKHGFYAKYKIMEKNGKLFSQDIPTIESKLPKPYEQT